MKCNKCDSSDIKTRTNYSHGKKSKATVSATCKKCGSTDIQKVDDKKFRGRRR